MTPARHDPSAPAQIAAADEAIERGYDSRPHFDARLASALKRGVKWRTQRALRIALAGAGRALASGRAAVRATHAGAVQRILVVRVDLLGDVVLSLPAVRALKRAFPEAQIDMLVLRSTADVLRAEPEIARVLTFDPGMWRRPTGLLKPATWRDTLALVRTLREARYDLAISVSGDIGSILTRLSGARQRFGYAGEAYGHFLTNPLPGGRYQTHQHEVSYVQALAKAAGGIVAAEDARLKLHVAPDAALTVAEKLREARAKLGQGGPVIAIHAGARNGQAKRWPPTHIAALADRLAGELDALVVLTGAPNEDPLARAIARRVRTPILNLIGHTTIPELVALLAASDLLVTGDSGPLHIACAVRTPVVALHGPTDPAISGPTAPDAIVLRHQLWCAPCYDASATAECRFGNPVCMKAIAPSVVFAAARRQLERHGWKLPKTKAQAPYATFASHG